MVRRRLYVLGTLAIWLALLVVLAKISIDRLSAPSWGNPIGDESSAPIAGTSRIGQVFMAPLPGLHRIEIVVDRASSAGSRQVTFQLTQGPDAESELEAETFDISGATSGTPLSLEFAPIRTSKGQEFYFFVQSASATATDGISLRYGPESVLADSSAYLDGQPIAGNLEFRTYYSLRTRDKVDLLLTRLAEGRPYFLGTKGFYIALAVAYGVVLCAFLLFVARRILDENEGEP